MDFLRWFFGEAGAGWIAGVLGLVGLLYTWMSREKPAKIVIQEIKSLRLLDIHPSQSHRLSVLYEAVNEGQVPIHELFQKTLAIRNTGTKDILEEIDIKLSSEPINYEHSPSEWFVDIDFEKQANAVVEYGDESDGKSTAKICINIPYLNSYRVHEQLVIGRIISNKPISLDIIQGVGKGWSTRFISTSEMNRVYKNTHQVLRRAYLILISLGFLLMILSQVFQFTDLTVIARLQPSNENVQQALQAYQNEFHELEGAGLPRRLASALIYPLSSSSATFLALGFLLFLSGALINIGNTTIVLYIVEQFLNIKRHLVVSDPTLSETY